MSNKLIVSKEAQKENIDMAEVWPEGDKPVVKKKGCLPTYLLILLVVAALLFLDYLTWSDSVFWPKIILDYVIKNYFISK